MSSDRDDLRAQAAPRSVALFIDWDNFAIGLRQEMPDRPADVGPILRWSRQFGLLSVVRAYGEWRDPAERLAIYNAGVEVVYAPVLPLGGSVTARNGGGAKSLADTAMAVDVTDLLNLMPAINTIILATSDKDLIPVLRFAQRRGLRAIVVGSDRTAAALRDLADSFISYRQLLDQEGPSATAPLSRPVTVPPVRYPRAPRLPSIVPAPSRGEERRTLGSNIVPVAPRSVASTAGSVFAAPATAEEEEEESATAAARRRRRGGRRRRGREVDGSAEGLAEVSPATEADEEEQAEEVAADVVAEEVGEAVATLEPGELAAGGAEAAAEAEAEAEAEVEPEEQAEPAGAPGGVLPQAGEEGPRAGAPGISAEAPVRRGPVVLPGERLRRLAPVAPPEPEPVTESAEEPAPPAAPAPSEPEATEGRGRRRGGRTTAAQAAEPPAEAPAAAAEPEAPAGGEEEPTAPAARRARRGGRSRGRTNGQVDAEAGAAAPADEAPPAPEATSNGEPAEAAAETSAEPNGEAAGDEAPGAEGRPARSAGRGRRRGGRSR